MMRHRLLLLLSGALTAGIILGGCCATRKNFSLSNPKERTALTDTEIVDRLKRLHPDIYDDLFDDANDRLVTIVVATFSDVGPDLPVCVVKVPAYSDPRRYLDLEFVVFRGFQFVAKVRTVGVVREGLTCRLITASESDGAMPIRIGDGAQSRL